MLVLFVFLSLYHFFFYLLVLVLHPTSYNLHPTLYLRRGRLHVVAVEVALEVEVGELVTIGDGEELLERGIGLDVVLVLELVLLHVVVHALRHLRAAHESALGLREEGAELIRHLHGALEDGGGTGLCISTLLGLHSATALASILNLAVHTLVEALDLAHQRRGTITESGEGGEEALEVLIESRGGAGSGGRDLLHGGGGNHDGRGSGRGRRSGLRRSLLGGGLRGRGRSSSDHGLNNSDSLLLSDLLGDGLGGGTHYT